MRRGTTVTNTFTVDIDLTNAVVLYVTYKQNGSTILEKTIDEITITATELSAELTQAETLAFVADVPAQIQIRARLQDGSAVASNIINTNVAEILKDGVI